MATNVGLLLEQALAARRQGNWAVAQRLYGAAVVANPEDAIIHHNLALCLHALGHNAVAREHAETVTRRVPQLAQAWVLRARIERSLDEAESAEHSLRTALGISPGNPSVLLELANLTLNELGDARAVQRLVEPLLGNPEYGEDAQLATLMAKLYDRDENAEEFTRQIIAFSRRYLRIPDFRFTAKRKQRPADRKAKARVGLLSPLFSVSPVYFFTIGALTILAKEWDLVILNRGTQNDWGTEKFRAIAREWHDVAHLPAEALANAIYANNLNLIIDLGGWTDPIGLKALSTRPAPKMFKWVGGQSCTTGLDVFDGFISDEQQTPNECRHLYTEPLLLIESGYVSYTPPDYMPTRASATKTQNNRAGVISNPVKISAAFLTALAAKRRDPKGGVGKLTFIDRRYRHAAVRERVLRGLAEGQPTDAKLETVEFIAPTSHREYLQQVSELGQVIDTFPYNGGLTTAEALHWRVPCLTAKGELFSERHSLGHCHYAGYEPAVTPAQHAKNGRWQLHNAAKINQPGSRHVHDRQAGVAAALLAGIGGAA